VPFHIRHSGEPQLKSGAGAGVQVKVPKRKALQAIEPGGRLAYMHLRKGEARPVAGAAGDSRGHWGLFVTLNI
jgi:hypothetical protein